MIPLFLLCVFGGCLDQAIDTRPLFTQIYEDQIVPKENPIYRRNNDCEQTYGRKDPRVRNCGV